MNELIAKIKELNAALVADAELQAEKGNKAAIRQRFIVKFSIEK